MPIKVSFRHYLSAFAINDVAYKKVRPYYRANADLLYTEKSFQNITKVVTIYHTRDQSE